MGWIGRIEMEVEDEQVEARAEAQRLTESDADIVNLMMDQALTITDVRGPGAATAPLDLNHQT